ncbi:MAG: Crp/Fnr family transcriptional regulator [Anaerolineales bacterium]|nr:MAG: Crp/Fnr family transcriptional regulator [Anaerolineales bacterium]
MTPRRKTPLRIEVTETHQCSVDLRLQILHGLPFFADLPHADVKHVNHLFHEYGYAPNETICFAGDPAERLFVVADGRVKLMRHSLSGKNVLLDMLTPGEFFGSLSALGEDVYPDTAEAQTQSCVLSISAADFRHVLEKHPKVALKVLETTALRLRDAQERVRQLSALTVEGRVANVLLVLGKKFGRRSDVGLLIEAPMTRDDLAAMTGTTTESASRVMSQFQKDGLIQTGRKWVSILDQKALEQAANAEAG